MHTYSWFTLLYSENQHVIIFSLLYSENQHVIIFSLKKKKKPKQNSEA